MLFVVSATVVERVFLTAWSHAQAGRVSGPAAERPLAPLARAAASAPLPRVAGPPPREGRDGLPPRREPVVAAPAARRARRHLRLQLLGAADRRRHAARPRACATSPPAQPGPRRLRHHGGRGALRLSDGEPRGPRLVDPPHRAGAARAHLVGEVLDRLRAAARASRPLWSLATNRMLGVARGRHRGLRR